jgi:hypothetical protein
MGRVYLCTGFAKRLPVFFSPQQSIAFDDYINDDEDYGVR